MGQKGPYATADFARVSEGCLPSPAKASSLHAEDLHGDCEKAMEDGAEGLSEATATLTIISFHLLEEGPTFGRILRLQARTRSIIAVVRHGP